ncbi:PepSY-associated TM helix domain-containing protein [Bdellovibrio sp. HCB288]|uniref:PepSY-associated TM helix domain-containing protein n=1 Tax=Bdellovibrio sp. HCB288 TaxID=3394355 RepID=UPI0039B6CA1E
MKKDLYARIWRWHFYAGIFVIPFMIVLAITGSIYLFKPQLDPVVYPKLLTVSPQDKVLPAANIVSVVRKEFPTSQVSSYFPPTRADQSVAVGLSDAGINRTAYLNPYTGELLGSMNDQDHYQSITKKIHGDLLIGPWGDRLVELVACWSIILLISGLYLWWPRGRKFAGVWWVRLNAGKRIFWRDLHAVVAIYSFVFILLLLVTGLPWTGFWGEKYAKVWNHFPQATATSNVPSAVLNNASVQMVPWASETVPMPNSVVMQSEQISMDEVLKTLQGRDLEGSIKVAYPKELEGVFTISQFGGDPRRSVTLYVDQYSGQVVQAVPFSEHGGFAKAVEFGISLHQGELFGWVNQLIAFLTCLALILICVSGVMMWWKRRPSGKFAAPPAPDSKNPVWFIGIFVSMSALFPLVGVSLVAVIAIDFILSKVRAH